MGLRPMKGDENLAEMQLSRTSFDALTGGRVADRVNGKSEAFDRAGGLSGRLVDTRRIFSSFAVSMPEDTKSEKIPTNREWFVRLRPERPPAGTLACHTMKGKAKCPAVSPAEADFPASL